MPAPTPSDLLWEPLLPVAHALESLQSLLEWCAAYLPWCGGGLLLAAGLILTGVIIIQWTHEPSRSPASSHAAPGPLVRDAPR